MSKNSFVVYNDLLTILNEITDKDAGKLFKAMVQYSSTKEVCAIPESLKLLFISIRQTIDRDTKKYQELSELRSEFGRLGGVAKASKSQHKLASVSKAAVTVTDTDTVTDIKEKPSVTKEPTKLSEYIASLPENQAWDLAEKLSNKAKEARNG